MSAPPTRPPLSGGPRSPFARRIRTICGLSFGVFAALTFRLAYLQLAQHDYFLAQAESLRGEPVEIPPTRGALMDRNQTFLVHNEPAYFVRMDPNAWYGPSEEKAPKSTPDDRKKACLDALRRAAPELQIDAVLARRPLSQFKARNGKTRFRTYDLPKISNDAGKKLRSMGVVGLGLTQTTRRIIVDGTVAPQLVGVTNRNGLGLEGLEQSLNAELTGKPGKVYGEFDGRANSPLRKFWAVPMSVTREIPVQDGTHFVLTLDAAIQKKTQAALQEACEKHHAEAGTAVVLDPRTGEILAMANWPTFDLNRYTKKVPLALTNQAVALPYEPGSILKPVTLAAALDRGVVTPESYFYCTGSVKIGNKTIHCAAHGGSSAHGDETLTDVLRNSCNVATAECALRLRADRLSTYLDRFSLTRRTGSGLLGEHAGLHKPYPTWTKVKLANVGFGQGISVTSLQLAAAYGAFATGEYRTPHIVRGKVDPKTGAFHAISPDAARRVISERTARQMRAMLQAVVDRGTGRLARLSGYTAGGKTGTAQVAENRVYGKKYVASFVGMAPIVDPRLVVLVAIRDPKGQEHYGGEVAAPAFKTIAEGALRELRVPPDRPEASPTPVKGAAPHSFAD